MLCTKYWYAILYDIRPMDKRYEEEEKKTDLYIKSFLRYKRN